jgi:hypothetical protein
MQERSFSAAVVSLLHVCAGIHTHSRRQHQQQQQHTHIHIQTAKPKRASGRATSSSSSSRRRIYTSTPSEYNTPLATRQDPLKVGLLGTERAPTLCVRARERESCLQMISWFLACDVNEKNMTQANSIFPRAPPPCVMLLLEPSRESCTLDSN